MTLGLHGQTRCTNSFQVANTSLGRFAVEAAGGYNAFAHTRAASHTQGNAKKNARTHTPTEHDDARTASVRRTGAAYPSQPSMMRITIGSSGTASGRA